MTEHLNFHLIVVDANFKNQCNLLLYAAQKSGSCPICSKGTEEEDLSMNKKYIKHLMTGCSNELRLNRFVGNIFITNLQYLLLNTSEQELILIGDKDSQKNTSLTYAFSRTGEVYS
jgi:hypothetical protein